MSNNILTAFNDHFIEFVSDIQNVFPEDADILTAKNALLAIRKANPKLLVRIWVKYISNPYKNQIDLNNYESKSFILKTILNTFGQLV